LVTHFLMSIWKEKKLQHHYLPHLHAIAIESHYVPVPRIDSRAGWVLVYSVPCTENADCCECNLIHFDTYDLGR
jgi:hypothetical protein